MLTETRYPTDCEDIAAMTSFLVKRLRAGLITVEAIDAASTLGHKAARAVCQHPSSPAGRNDVHWHLYLKQLSASSILQIALRVLARAVMREDNYALRSQFAFVLSRLREDVRFGASSSEALKSMRYYYRVVDASVNALNCNTAVAVRVAMLFEDEDFRSFLTDDGAQWRLLEYALAAERRADDLLGDSQIFKEQFADVATALVS